MESAAAQNWLCEQPKSQVSRSAKPVSVACHSGQGITDAEVFIGYNHRGIEKLALQAAHKHSTPENWPSVW